MKKLFSILILLLTLAAEASHQTKLAIVTSFKTTDGKNIFNFINYDSNKKVENRIKKKFDPNKFDLKIIHHATLSDVWNVLHDESIDGLIFVAHGTQDSAGVIGSESLILNENFVNLKYAFSNVGSNLKYMAIISCYSEQAIAPFIEKGFYKNAPKLKITTFADKIELMKGIDIAIENSLGHIATVNPQGKLEPMLFEDSIQSENDFSQDETFDLTRTYTAEAAPAAALVVYNERAVGFFDDKNSSETIQISLPKKDLHKASSSLLIDTGETVLKKKLDLGELTLNELGQRDCQLKAERNKKGEILGVSKNYYKLKCAL